MALLFVQSDAPVEAIGEFSDMRYTEEHAYGHSIQLWRAGDEFFGLFLAADGLAGDPPTGRLQDLRFDQATGRLRFHARLPVHGLFVFDGTLSGDEIDGELTRRSPAVKKSRVQLCLLAGKPPAFVNFEAWDRWARWILSFRGPKRYPIRSYLARGLVLEEQLPSPPGAMPASDAVRAAIDTLESYGVSDIRICRLRWVIAPLGAGIVLARGRWQFQRGTFSVFSIEVHDGTEARYGGFAGKLYTFLARGADAGDREMYFDGERVRLFTEMDEPEDELYFEFVSREELAALPDTCR